MTTFVRNGDFIQWTDKAGVEREAIVFEDETDVLTIDGDMTSPENVDSYRSLGGVAPVYMEETK